jgi:hypothetical protein
MGLADPSLHVTLFVHTKRVLTRDGPWMTRLLDDDDWAEREALGKRTRLGFFKSVEARCGYL